MRHARLAQPCRHLAVSIHAPAKGATGGAGATLEEGDVSIPAPAKGATRPVPRGQARLVRFQSTHPRRVRQGRIGQSPVRHPFQSTHPRRVRRLAYELGKERMRFQSTHPRRVRRKTRVERYNSILFQSTHPRRVRLRRISLASMSSSLFQSTHPRRVRRSKYTSAVICRGGLCGRRWRYSFMKRSATSDMALSSRFLREPPAALTELEVRAIQLIPISTTSPLDRKLFSHRVVPRDASSSFQDCRREGCPSPRR